jgi:hypothetical protein
MYHCCLVDFKTAHMRGPFRGGNKEQFSFFLQSRKKLRSSWSVSVLYCRILSRTNIIQNKCAAREWELASMSWPAGQLCVLALKWLSIYLKHSHTRCCTLFCAAKYIDSPFGFFGRATQNGPCVCPLLSRTLFFSSLHRGGDHRQTAV